MSEFFWNIKQELKRITWPTAKERKLNTMQVFVFMVALSLFFAAVDAVISTGVAAINREAEEEEYGYEEYDLDDLLEYEYEEVESDVDENEAIAEDGDED